MLLQLLQNLFRFASLRDATKRARTVHSVSRPSLFTPHNDATRTPHHARHHTRRAHQPHAGIHRREPRAIRARARSSPPRASRARRPTTTTTTLNPSHEHTHTHTSHPIPTPTPSTRTTHHTHATNHARIMNSFIRMVVRSRHSFIRLRSCSFVSRVSRVAHRIASHRIAPVPHRARKTHRRSHRARRRHRSTPHPHASSQPCARLSSGTSRQSNKTHHASSIDRSIDRSIRSASASASASACDACMHTTQASFHLLCVYVMTGLYRQVYK